MINILRSESKQIKTTNNFETTVLVVWTWHKNFKKKYSDALSAVYVKSRDVIFRNALLDSSAGTVHN